MYKLLDVANKITENNKIAYVMQMAKNTFHDQMIAFKSLYDALETLERSYSVDYEPLPGINHAIYIWEVLPSGHAKIVWAYVGPDYNEKEKSGGIQGVLPGWTCTLLEAVLEDNEKKKT